jgi:hypothetical protein
MPTAASTSASPPSAAASAVTRPENGLPPCEVRFERIDGNRQARVELAHHAADRDRGRRGAELAPHDQLLGLSHGLVCVVRVDLSERDDLRVIDDADDLKLRFLVATDAPQERSADRIGAGPEVARRGCADDRDARTVVEIIRGERASAHYG